MATHKIRSKTMTSVYTTLVVISVICALVAALAWLSYKYGRVTVVKEQALESIQIRQEAENEMEKLKKVSTAELDTKLSQWMRDDK